MGRNKAKHTGWTEGIRMDGLIRIKVNDKQEQVVEGRELHKILEVGAPYDKWFPRMCEYGFIEQEDFSTILSESTGSSVHTYWTQKGRLFLYGLLKENGILPMIEEEDA